MGRKNVARKLLDSSVSLAANYNSPVTEITQGDNIGYIIQSSGITDNTGTWKVQVRNTDTHNNTSSWADLTLTSVPTYANSDNVFTIVIDGAPWNEMRLVFTAAGGTPDGTAQIYITVKQVGG